MNTLTVLLAEDHVYVREMVAGYLRSQPGIGLVVEAADGEEAMAMAERLRPDLVLLDLHMPKQDGLDVTRRIKRMAPETRVFIFSVHADEDYRTKAREYEADGFIDKYSLKQGLITMIAGEEAYASGKASRVAAA